MEQGYEVHDPGHRYELMAIDGDCDQILQFVKREDRDHPTKYPRNEGFYPGTTLQCVIRVLADRIRYLNGQKACIENHVILFLLQSCLWLLEKRAARRHGRPYNYSPEFSMTAPLCDVCGHTVCEHGGGDS